MFLVCSYKVGSADVRVQGESEEQGARPTTAPGAEEPMRTTMGNSMNTLDMASRMEALEAELLKVFLLFTGRIFIYILGDKHIVGLYCRCLTKCGARLCADAAYHSAARYTATATTRLPIIGQ